MRQAPRIFALITVRLQTWPRMGKKITLSTRLKGCRLWLVEDTPTVVMACGGSLAKQTQLSQ